MVLQSLALKVVFVLQVLQVLDVLLRFLVCRETVVNATMNFTPNAAVSKRVTHVQICK